MDRLAARYRGVRAATTETAQARRSRRGLVSYLDDDGTFVIIVRLVPEDGEAVRRAVEGDAEKSRRARQRSPDCPEAGIDRDVDEVDEQAKAFPQKRPTLPYPACSHWL